MPSTKTDRSKPMVSIAAKALLLDLDGTLVDSSTAVESAWRWAAEQLGVPFSQIAPYVHGIPADQALELAIPGIDGPTKSRLAGEILIRQAESNAAVVPMPGALRLLDAAALGELGRRHQRQRSARRIQHSQGRTSRASHFDHRR